MIAQKHPHTLSMELFKVILFNENGLLGSEDFDLSLYYKIDTNIK